MFLLTTKCSSILTMIISISLNAESEGRGSPAWLLSLANWETASCRPTLLALPCRENIVTLLFWQRVSLQVHANREKGLLYFNQWHIYLVVSLWRYGRGQATRWLNLVMTGRSANCTNNQQGLPLTWANLPPLSLIQVDDQNTLEKLIISISPAPAHTFPPQQSLGKR